MTRPAIVVENLTKVYRIGKAERRSDTLVGAALSALKAPARNFRDLYRLGTAGRDESDDTIRALDDVSFEVAPGEVLGVIGRNGAGKSTLLKVLSRITRPTSGRVRMRGRVSSLLEVGTGFHPELTGRENVYLNGTILGMTKREIDRKFDEIVDFSGVEKFLDTPVKRYSSGMKVRLAFAVAAHLEPEILIIDEVLAVGDAEFQKKCLGKMEDVARCGRTVLFVSHDMTAVNNLCSTAILIERGRVEYAGAPSDVVVAHLGGIPRSERTDFRGAVADGPIRLDKICVRQNGRQVHELLDSTKPFEVAIQYHVLEPVSNLLLGFDVISASGAALFRSYDLETCGLGPRLPGDYESVCRFKARLFNSGSYFLNLLLGIHRARWLSRGSVAMRLNFGSLRETDVDYLGALHPPGEWDVVRHSEKESVRNGRIIRPEGSERQP